MKSSFCVEIHERTANRIRSAVIREAEEAEGYSRVSKYLYKLEASSGGIVVDVQMRTLYCACMYVCT